MISINYRGRIV